MLTIYLYKIEEKMKNPINYFKECIKSIDDKKKEILSGSKK